MSDIVLRASSARSFSEVPSQWYKNHILKEDKFTGNTATNLGSIVHLFAETYFTEEEFNPDMILSECDADIDVELIKEEYPGMCEALKVEYLDFIETPDHIEFYSSFEKDGITFQGTCDSINGSVLVDYKTSKMPVKKIDMYVDQLNIYAYLVSLKGITIDTLRVVNIARRTKTLPARVVILECEADVKDGKRLVELMIDKTNLAIRNPEYRDLIFNENNYSFLSNGFNVSTKIINIKEGI